jgi:hypothetical protein
MRLLLLLLIAGILASPLLAAPLIISVSENGERLAHEGHLDLAISAATPSGTPLKDAQIHARLWHVDDYGFFTTDIPYVQGEPVFEIDTVAKNGTLHVRANTPIPGKYVLDARASDASGGNEAAGLSQIYDVPQIPEKNMRGALLLAFLFLAGLAGGYYFLSGRGE